MANYFYIELDTTPPLNLSLNISNTEHVIEPLVTCNINTDDISTENYQIKIWGDIDTTFDPSIKATENESSWISYIESRQIKLSTHTGLKVIHLKIRDDVHNETSVINDITKLTSFNLIVIVSFETLYPVILEQNYRIVNLNKQHRNVEVNKIGRMVNLSIIKEE